MISLHDTKAIKQLYTTNNVHFDKHPSVQLFTLPLTGKSILVYEKSTNWRQRRKAMLCHLLFIKVNNITLLKLRVLR